MFDVNTAVFNAIHRGEIVYGLRMPNGETLVTIDNQHGWVMEEADMQFNPAKLNREKALPFSMDCVGDEKCRLTLCDKLSIRYGWTKAIFIAQNGKMFYVNAEYLCEVTDMEIRLMPWLIDEGEYKYYCAGEREPIYVCNRVGEDLMVCGVVMPLRNNEAKL